MVVRVWVVAAAAWTMLAGAQTLHIETLQRYLVKRNNPFYYETMADFEAQKHRITQAKGAFDTRLQGIVERKAYPTGEARYEEATLAKTLPNGIEIAAGYRRAIGTQEYNNIKTGEEGEMRAILRLPVVALWQGTNAKSAAYEAARYDVEGKAALRREAEAKLLKEAAKNLADAVYYTQLVRLLKRWEGYAAAREDFVRRQVDEGVLPDTALADAQSERLKRRRLRIEAQDMRQRYVRRLAMMLGMTYKRFTQRFRLPSLERLTRPLPSKAALLAKARRRAMLRYFAADTARLDTQLRLNALAAYPEAEVTLTGVRDVAYDKEGYKITASLRFPVERNAYRGERERLKAMRLNVANRQTLFLRRIETRIETLLHSIRLCNERDEVLRREIALHRRLVKAERQRFREGAGTLVEVNRREQALLERIIARTDNRYATALLRIEARYEAGEYGIISP